MQLLYPENLPNLISAAAHQATYITRSRQNPAAS